MLHLQKMLYLNVEYSTKYLKKWYKLKLIFKVMTQSLFHQQNEYFVVASKNIYRIWLIL